MAKNSELGIVNALAHFAGDAAGGPELLARLLGLGGQSGAEAGPRNDIAHQIALDMQSNLGGPSTEGMIALLREAQALDPSLVPAVDLDDLDPAAVADLMAAIDFEAIFDALLRQTFEGFAARPGVEAQAVPDLAAITATDESEFDDDGDLLGDGEALAEDLTGPSLAAPMSVPVGNGVSEQAEADDLTALGLEELMDLPVSARIGGEADAPPANLALHGAGANTLTLSAQAVLDMFDTDIVTVFGDGADTVNAGTGWTDGGSAGGIHSYTQAVGAVTVTMVIDDDISINPDIV